MKIIECHFELGGFDDRLVRGGISVYLWNLCRQFAAAGHEVSGLTASHGLLAELRKHYEVEDLEWRKEVEIPVRLDPQLWATFPPEIVIAASVTAHRFRVADVDLFVLDGGLLREHSASFYPPYELKGRDISFLKPLMFQVMAARFLADTVAPGTVVHLHEPYYHYLIPASLKGSEVVAVSTVQSNMPVNKKVYGPEVRRLLTYLGADVALADGLMDDIADTTLNRAMRSYLPATLLYNDYPERQGHDYISVLGLLLRSVHALDFLSPGQLEHVATQIDTPFQQLFEQLAIREEFRAHRNRLVVGGCGIAHSWLSAERTEEHRRATLTRLHLDPSLPTIYHNARYAVQHKGQEEMIRALLHLLGNGERANVLLHCLAPLGIDLREFAELAERHADLVRVRTDSMEECELMEWALASDICLFPSKFEMDTFLMAMGEAMACGAVPLATAQLGMAHFGQSFNVNDGMATGLAMPRSFRINDSVLVDAIESGLRTMLYIALSQPERMLAWQAKSIAVARTFTWQRAASRLADIFVACTIDDLPPPDPASLLARGWADLLTDEELESVRDTALAEARRTGDLRLARRLLSEAALDENALFASARARVDLGACSVIAADTKDPHFASVLRNRSLAQRVDDAVALHWAFAPAARVEVVVPPQRSGAPNVVALQPTADGSFTGRVHTNDTELALLITLPNGRAVWDQVKVDLGEAVHNA